MIPILLLFAADYEADSMECEAIAASSLIGCRYHLLHVQVEGLEGSISWNTMNLEGLVLAFEGRQEVDYAFPLRSVPNEECGRSMTLSPSLDFSCLHRHFPRCLRHSCLLLFTSSVYHGFSALLRPPLSNRHRHGSFSTVNGGCHGASL